MSFHVVSVHDGKSWSDDQLVEGDFGSLVRQLLGGEPERARTIVEGMSHAFYRNRHSALVMTLKEGTTRERAERHLRNIREEREDRN